MITAISSFNPNKVNFTANPGKAARRGIEIGEKMAGKVGDSFEKATPKGLTPSKLQESLPMRFDDTEGSEYFTSTAAIAWTIGMFSL